jgi:hypothetical protein
MTKLSEICNGGGKTIFNKLYERELSYSWLLRDEKWYFLTDVLELSIFPKFRDQESIVSRLLTREDGTKRLSQNVGEKLSLLAA